MGLILNGMRVDKRINDTSVAYDKPEALKFENVYLKEGTSVIDPVFIIQKPTVTALPPINYLYCNEFHRYYWVKNIIQQAGRSKGSAYFMELHCHVDVLGSWYSEIGQVPCYVKYCSDYDWIIDQGSDRIVDLTQDDERLSSDVPLLGEVTTLLNSTVADWFTGNPVYQPFAITLGQLGPGITSSKIYVLTRDMFASFFKALWETSEFETYVTNSDKYYEWMAEKLGGVLLDPASFIQDIRQLPFKCEGTTDDPLYGADGLVKVAVGKMTEIKDGADTIWGRDYKGHNNFTLEEYEVELTIPGVGAPDATFDVAFLRRKKYMQVILTTPFGDVNLSTDNFVYKDPNDSNKVKLKVKVLVERTTGDIGIQVYEFKTGELLGKVSGNLSLNQTHMIQPGGYAQNGEAGQIKNFSNILSTVGGGATALGGAIGLGVGGPAGMLAGSAIGSAIGGLSHLVGGFTTNHAKAIETATSNGGTIIANPNSWMDMYLQTGYNDSAYTPKLRTDFTQLFRIICTVFVPKVCTTVQGYKDYAALFGYPCNRMVSSFEGLNKDKQYIQCAQYNIKGASGSANMYPAEMEEINQFLNSGIYWNTSPYEPTP